MKTHEALITAQDAAGTEVTVVGGKGRQLGELLRYGLPVPDFFVIPAHWSQQRQDGVQQALKTLIQAELVARRWQDVPLAVRSSAVGEDARHASFAGIYRSYLNICELSALLVAIESVWASLDSPAACAYRERLGLSGPECMAVIVMPLLGAQAAGIGFTCDPVSGREDRLVIHANWGLGESLVNGEAVGDEYLFAEDETDTWRLTDVQRACKHKMRVAVAGGGSEQQAVLPENTGRQVLDTAAAEQLAALLHDAALALDCIAPFYDLEWVWDGERFWLVQARRITRRPYHTYRALQGQPVLWTRGNTCEVMPEPLSPMDWAFSRRAVNDLLTPGWRLAGYPLLEGVQRAGLFAGRLYLEASILQWEAWDAIGLMPERLNAMMGGHQSALKVSPASGIEGLKRGLNIFRYLVRAPAMRRRGQAEIAMVWARVKTLAQTPLPEDSKGLESVLFALLPVARQVKGMHFLQGAGGGSLSLLLDTLERIFPGESEAIGAALLAGGEPSETAQQGYALLELAQLAKPLLKSGGSVQTLQECPEFASAFERFLEAYGHRGHYETYLRSPRWREQPEHVLAQLPDLAGVDVEMLRLRQHNAAHAAWQRIATTAPWWARRVLPGQVKAANRDCNLREAARSALIALAAAARRLWLAVGEHLVGQGYLQQREEIFLLMPSEVLHVARQHIPVSGIQARLAARAAQFAQWQASKPEEWLWVSDGQQISPEVAASLSGLEQVPVTAKMTENNSGTGWQGVATGTGIARGKVRRLDHPAAGMQLQPGEILVAPSTDPGWTPLFLKAGGLVVETGGYLSHGAIVAREFALPAVVNLPGILDLLHDGEEIEVDGMTGIVRRC